jgi:hypothetical protein
MIEGATIKAVAVWAVRRCFRLAPTAVDMIQVNRNISSAKKTATRKVGAPSMDTNERQFDLASQEIARHIEDAKTSKVAHFRMADRNAEWERAMQRIGAISFAGIVVFWFVSTQLYTLIEAFGGSVRAPWKTATQNALPIGFAIANVVATTFLYLNRFGEKCRLHREAAQRYHRFWRKCLNWQTECPDASHAAALVAKAVSFREELSDINQSSPDIEEWAWKTVDVELAKGGTDYDVDKSPE